MISSLDIVTLRDLIAQAGNNRNKAQVAHAHVTGMMMRLKSTLDAVKIHPEAWQLITLLEDRLLDLMEDEAGILYGSIIESELLALLDEMDGLRSES